MAGAVWALQGSLPIAAAVAICLAIVTDEGHLWSPLPAQEPHGDEQIRTRTVEDASARQYDLMRAGEREMQLGTAESRGEAKERIALDIMLADGST